jgi:predicted metalloprotease with PDZ domain
MLARIARVPLATLALVPWLAAAVVAAPTPTHARPDGAASVAKLATQAWPAAAEREPFVYTVAMPDPHRHEFQVSLAFAGLPGDAARLELPKWNPGAYHLTDAHRNVRGVLARGPEGGLLPVAKLDENTWEVGHGGQPFTLDYQVYCGRYTGISGCYLDDGFGFFNGVYLLMYAVGHKQRPIELRLRELTGGSGTQAVTGLPPMPAKRRAKRSDRATSSTEFWAENYDVLVDSPVHVGAVEIVEFELGGRPIRAAFSAKGGWQADEVREQLRKITEASAAVFGPLGTALPFRDYTFIYHVLPDNGGGLEHLNSTVIGVDPWMFAEADGAGLRRFWSVTAHEFFHLWNVKRIRPSVLGPFDYDREVHTTLLWFSEGFTSYYAALILSRAGLVDEAQTLAELSRRLAAVESRAGRTKLSVEQSSWETWAKPDDYDNAYFSYYDKGALLGVLFDLQLRASTSGRASTDTVFRELWRRWRDTGLGITPAELEQVFVDQAMLGGPAAAEEIRVMFRDYVRGTVELDYDRYLVHAGLRLVRRSKSVGPWIGAEVRGVEVRNVVHGAPGDAGGLAIGDRIMAIDGAPVTGDEYSRILAALAPDQAHEFTVARTGRTLKLAITPEIGGDPKFEIVDLDTVSPEQTRLRAAWLEGG